MKSTALAYSNIAFIKYWGKADSAFRLPLNSSLSMNLDNLRTVTTVEFSPDYAKDEVVIDGQRHENESARVIRHLDRLRELSKTGEHAKVVSENNFPSSHGLSSSASGFAALTLAAVNALGLKFSEKALSVLARLGSGSACRSVPGGFVEWQKGMTSEDSYARTVFPANHWKIVDVVAVVSDSRKSAPTTDSQVFALTSPFMSRRLENLSGKLKNLRKALEDKDFTQFGKIVESEALELHAVIMTQTPTVIYFLPETLAVIHEVRKWRNEGLEAYFTVNTGHDVHIISRDADRDKVKRRLKELKIVKNIIINSPAGPARLIPDHLF